MGVERTRSVRSGRYEQSSHGKVLPFDPMPQILRCPGPSEGMGKEFVVFPDAVHDMVDQSLPAPPTASAEVPSAEGPQQQLGRVEPRGVLFGVGQVTK
jgi:hypothetical protein